MLDPVSSLCTFRHADLKETGLLIVCALFFLGSVVYAAESARRPDLRIYWTQLQRTSSGVFFYGEVMNVGLDTAKRVRVAFQIKTEQGVVVATDTAEVDPENLRPGETGIFRKRVPYLTEASGYGWSSKAEWSE